MKSESVESIGKKFKNAINKLSLRPLKVKGFRYHTNSKTFYVLVKEWNDTEMGEEAESRLFEAVRMFERKHKHWNFKFDLAMDVSGKDVKII